MDFKEKEISSNYVYKGKILSLRVDDVELPSGKKSKREYVEHRGGAGVLAVDGEGYVYLVKQYRYAYREELMEIPAGKLEEGEEPICAAYRELGEETGLCGKISPFGLLYPTPGYTNESLYIFLATELKRGESHPDDGEFLSVVRIKFEEALDMVLSGKIRDAKTSYAILRYALLRKNQGQ